MKTIIVIALGIGFVYSLPLRAAEPLPFESALPVVESLVDFCIAPRKQDKAITAVVKDIRSPDLARFHRVVYDGITDKEANRELIRVRSETYAGMLTGTRFRLFREFTSECQGSKNQVSSH